MARSLMGNEERGLGGILRLILCLRVVRKYILIAFQKQYVLCILKQCPPYAAPKTSHNMQPWAGTDMHSDISLVIPMLACHGLLLACL